MLCGGIDIYTVTHHGVITSMYDAVISIFKNEYKISVALIRH